MEPTKKIVRNRKSKKFNYRSKIALIGHSSANPSKLITWIGTNRIRYDNDVPPGGCELTSCEVTVGFVVRLDFIYLNDIDANKMVSKTSDVIVLVTDGDHKKDENRLVEVMSEGNDKVNSYWLVGDVSKYLGGNEDIFV